MGFIASSTTVTVEAKLTDAGKKKLYESIETNSSGFITKFAIGDSDTNYGAIALGAPALVTGHVPEASDFKPSLRSFALFSGQYRPGVPVLLINDEYGGDNGVTRQLSVGANENVSLTFTTKTEWPKDESFTEAYSVKIQAPSNISEAGIRALFTVNRLESGEYIFSFNGNASIEQLLALIGSAGSGNNTSIPIQVIGAITHAQVIFNVELTQ